MSDREEMQAARSAGLVKRHETRLARACVFCARIVNGEYDREHPGVSFEPLNPVVPGHRLFVSALHLVDASQDIVATGRVFSAAAEYARRQGEDFNLITSGGSLATQTVFHLHVHYVPRTLDDGLTLPWTGQKIEEASR